MTCWRRAIERLIRRIHCINIAWWKFLIFFTMKLKYLEVKSLCYFRNEAYDYSICFRSFVTENAGIWRRRRWRWTEKKRENAEKIDPYWIHWRGKEGHTAAALLSDSSRRKETPNQGINWAYSDNERRIVCIPFKMGYAGRCKKSYFKLLQTIKMILINFRH